MSVTPGSLVERLTAVRGAVAEAARAAGRDAAELTTVVITKNHPASLVHELLDLGVLDLGENRHQEAVVKAAAVTGREVRWHFVGQLQSNKARAVREYADVLHSVDRLSLIRVLNTADAETDAGMSQLDCFLQIDLSGAPGRGGADPADMEALADSILNVKSLRLRGLMAVAPLGEEPRAAFARLRVLSEHLQRLVPDATDISAGMSGDFAEAILEGATHLRIGTAITGKRTEAV